MPKNKIILWFGLWVAVMLIIVVLTQPKVRPLKIDTISFGTTESAELYFKNVRAFYYATSEEGGGIMDVYRMNTLFEDSIGNFLPFAFYNNWRSNEAFVRIDTNYILKKNYSYVILDSAGVKRDSLAFPAMYNESQFEFARTIYQGLNRKYRIALVSGKNEPHWLTESNIKATKMTLKDYFRLVGKL